MTRAEILDAAKACVCGQREEDYGTPEDNFGLIAQLWGVYLRKKCCVSTCILPEDVAAMMALLKIARIAAGGKRRTTGLILRGTLPAAAR